MEFIPLGTSAASPGNNRHLSAYILKDGKNIFLFDCGEGTQFQLAKYHISILKISKIFISHLHGDHFYGLFPLISTMSLNGRKTPLEIYSPPGLREMFEAVVILSHQTFEIEFIETHPDDHPVLIETEMYKVKSFPLLHSIPTSGYIYYQKQRKPNIKKEAIEKYKLTVEEIKNLIKGEDIIKDSQKLFASELTFFKKLPISFAYCTDTGYFEELVGYLDGVDYMYHESTFLVSDNDLAVKRQHSTAYDAARIAKNVGVKYLFLGHFSNRYIDSNVFENEARKVFPFSKSCIEGEIYELK